MLVLAAVLIYHGYKFGLPYLYKSAFEEKLFQVAEHAFHQSREDVYRIVSEAALEYHIEIGPKNIDYEETRSEIFIEVDYDVPVETPLIKRTLNFSVSTRRRFSH